MLSKELIAASAAMLAPETTAQLLNIPIIQMLIASQIQLLQKQQEVEGASHNASKNTPCDDFTVASLSSEVSGSTCGEESGSRQETKQKVKTYRNKNLREEKTTLLTNTITESEAHIIFEKLSKMPRHSRKRNWTVDETKLFFYIVAKYLKEKEIHDSDLTPKDWALITKAIPGRTIEQCMYKWSMAKDPKTKKTVWTEEENTGLIEIVRKAGVCDWVVIAEEFNKLDVSPVERKAKQCRERWHNFLNPDINRDEWSLEEDVKLCDTIADYGKKWSIIAKILQGRTENAVKNRYNSLVRKEKKKFFKHTSKADTSSMDADLNSTVDKITNNKSTEIHDKEEELEHALFLSIHQKVKKEANCTTDESTLYQSILGQISQNNVLKKRKSSGENCNESPSKRAKSEDEDLPSFQEVIQLVNRSPTSGK